MTHPLLTSVLDFLLPPSPDARHVRALTPETLCGRMCVQHINGAVTLLPYTDTDVRSAIHEAKYRHNTRAQDLLAHVLTHYLRENHFERGVLIPIPLHSARLRERGYNQVTEVLKNVARDNETYLLNERILTRVRNTPRQTDRSRYERLTNIKDAFAAHPEHIPDTEILILVDDVTTTGATLREARETLSDACHKDIICIALAH